MRIGQRVSIDAQTGTVEGMELVEGGTAVHIFIPDAEKPCATCGDADHVTAEHVSPLDGIPDDEGSGHRDDEPWSVTRERTCTCGHPGKVHSAHGECNRRDCACRAFIAAESGGSES